ncbi:fumarate reductase subunit FrdD [Haliea sp.]
MRRSHEPIAWSLFGAGGMLLAFIGPGLVLSTALLPWLAAENPAAAHAAIGALLAHPLGKLLVLACIALPLFHTLHRICHGLDDLHLPAPRLPLQLLCYGGATLLCAVTAWWLLTSIPA